MQRHGHQGDMCRAEEKRGTHRQKWKGGTGRKGESWDGSIPQGIRIGMSEGGDWESRGGEISWGSEKTGKERRKKCRGINAKGPRLLENSRR